MDAIYDVTENQTSDVEDAKSEEYADVTAEDMSGTDTDGEYADGADRQDVDYEALIAEDVTALRAEFPELRGIKDITDINNPLRYAALRDLGLTPAEAYMATAKRRTQDTRAHLKSAHGKSASTALGMMSQKELAAARELFPGMSDADLQHLYKKVTK